MFTFSLKGNHNNGLAFSKHKGPDFLLGAELLQLPQMSDDFGVLSTSKDMPRMQAETKSIRLLIWIQIYEPYPLSKIKTEKSTTS